MQVIPSQVFAQGFDLSAFVRAFAVVSVAELFDKTWFMALILTLKYDPRVVFVGCYAGLVVHTILAAAFGMAAAQYFSPLALDLMSVAVFGSFALLYAKDFYYAEEDSDVISAGKEEAQEDTGLDQEDTLADQESGTVNKGYGLASPVKIHRSGLLKCFMGTFIAEWGDRTQIAMVGQHAALPLMPVFFGSLLAFALLTLSAVAAAKMLQSTKVSERHVHAVSSVFFALFTVISLADALEHR